MRAERDDRPKHLSTRKKKGPWGVLIAVGIVSAVAWGLAMNYGSPVVLDIAKIKEGIHFGGKPVFDKPQLPTPAPEQITPTPGVSYTPEPQRAIAREQLPATEAAATQQPRQTVFNDRNYTPKGAANVTAFQVQPEQQLEVKTENRTRIAVIKEAPRAEDRCKDWYREGSLEFRDCRRRLDLKERHNGN